MKLYQKYKENREYVRDGRAPIPKNINTSRVMSANKAKDTKPELEFRRALRKAGLAGYRLHWKIVPGNPDIVFLDKKTAIFINGCFWHRCPYCKSSLPKSNRNFWRKKFEANIKRDKKKKYLLKKKGWTVFIFWECQIKKDVMKNVEKIKKFMNS
jgi:DNA mismatch endonuclease, patch repair protein